MNINRHKLLNLSTWKNKQPRMPLLLKGARQVGKTFLIREFGKQFPHFHEINFQKNPELKEIFKTTNDPLKIKEYLEIFFNTKIHLESDLIFFDEIQDCPEALNSLKFFSENLPHSFIVGAGSLLGIYLSTHTFPVGKVEFLDLHPLSFCEFLEAHHKNNLADLTKTLTPQINVFHQTLVDEMKKFMIIGGMPKVVSTFIETESYQEARLVQEHLLLSYKSDFSKYSGPVDALKILSVFDNIPKQLAKDNKKFQFNLLQKGARYAQFQSAIDWLKSAGLCYKVPILTHAEIPLKVYIEENAFKIYFFDTGLLGALSDLPVSTFLNPSDLFKTFKGAFSENFFLQEFYSQRKENLYSWQSNTAEVDFLYANENELCPIEVKSGESGRLKSLGVFCDKYHVKWRRKCTLLPLEIREDTHIKNLPLYLSALI